MTEAPSEERLASISCPRCSAENAPGAPQCSACGVFLPGHTLTLKSGIKSRRFQNAMLPEQAALREAVAERRIEWVNDLGSDLSFGQRDLVDRGLQLHVILDSLENDIAKFGVLTGKGAARACVSLYLTVLDKLLRIYQQLGLERRAKPIQSVGDIIREHKELK